jgi:hypothetical protein
MNFLNHISNNETHFNQSKNSLSNQIKKFPTFDLGFFALLKVETILIESFS